MKDNCFLKELSNLIFFWFFGIVFFGIFRLSFITIFREQIENTNFKDFLQTLLMGFRFDCTVVSYFLLIPILVLLIFSPLNKFNLIQNVRRIFQILFVVLSTLICVVVINYFSEYNHQFNHFLFLAFYDDQKAVVKTVLQDFHPILNSVSIILIILIGLLIFRHFERRKIIYSLLSIISFKGSRVLLTCGFIILFVGSIRGSFSERPAMRKWAAVSKDLFLNKTIINPYRSLKYAFEDFSQINLKATNPFLSDKEFHQLYPYKKVTEILRKEAGGSTIEKPKQIFLVIMESYDSWPLMDKYLPLGLSKNLKAIADEGTRFTTFLPAANSTFNSFGSIVTGVPYFGVNISNISELNDSFKTSVFHQFEKLGYTTNLFYGGFISWENIGGFCDYQGVNRIFSGADAGGKSDSGDWGVEDEKLFNLVLKNINPDEYTLNVILTSSYHPPYTIDIYKKGFPYKGKEDFPKNMQKYYDKGMTLDELGHLWYSDKAIGDFMKIAKEKYKESIFCFTGDHYGRRFITHTPNLYERSSVNFILYGENIPSAVNKTPGTHIDIIPTLIEMIAPKGFEYYSFGKSLFKEDKEKGIAFEKVVSNNEILFLPKEGKKYKILIDSMKESEVLNPEIYMTEYNKQMGLAWYYTIKGNDIKK